MQTLTKIPDNYTLTKYFAPFYELYSVKSLPVHVECDRMLARVLDFVNKKAGVPLSVSGGRELSIPVSERPEDGKRKVFVALSGGKDCLATAIMAKKEGLDPVLVYISGVNRSLFSERRCAQQAAAEAGFGYIEIKAGISGSKEWNEHPLKNILLLCMLIDEGALHGVTDYAFGSTFDDDSTYWSLDYDLSDSFDMIHMFTLFVRQHIPGFRLHQYMCNTMQSFYTVYRYNPRIIPLLSTCITPDYRRPVIRKRNESLYGGDVLHPNGCGSCYKCADYYLFSQSFGMVRSSREYARRCMQAKMAFDRNYVGDFKFDRTGFNRYGGCDTDEVQVLADRCGYYIGKLQYDRELNKWFTDTAFGHKHYHEREQAERVLERFKKLYRV